MSNDTIGGPMRFVSGKEVHRQADKRNPEESLIVIFMIGAICWFSRITGWPKRSVPDERQ